MRLETYYFQHEDQEPQAHYAGAANADITSKSQV